MKKTAAIVLPVALTALLAATAAWAQAADATGDGGQAVAAHPAAVQSSSEKVQENPAAQYVVVRTVVSQVIGVVDARAEPMEMDGYNLLKYCWSAENVLGDWAERAGTTGEMVVRALETRSWQRDLVRAGYPEAPVAEAIGSYEAALVTSGFTDAARTKAVDALVVDLDGIRRTTTGAAQARAIYRCEGQRRSFGLNVTTTPENGHVRFMPWVLHQVCQAQQLNADDPVHCDYWMNGKDNGPMSFAGETVYSVRWDDGSTANGRFDPEQSRSTGTVTLRLRPPKVTR
jgi:hypothetical protein